MKTLSKTIFSHIFGFTTTAIIVFLSQYLMYLLFNVIWNLSFKSIFEYLDMFLSTEVEIRSICVTDFCITEEDSIGTCMRFLHLISTCLAYLARLALKDAKK